MLNDSPKLDRAFQALSDPVRRGMLARLSRGPASVSELAAPLPISLPAVLQHLKALEASGLVASRKAGRVRTVRLEPEVLSAAERWLGEQRSQWEARIDRFEAHLATITKEEKE
jgi:DNA-binding transcriptional ArsR family regulator